MFINEYGGTDRKDDCEFDNLGNYPDELHHLEVDGGNQVYKSLISVNSQTVPNENEQTLRPVHTTQFMSYGSFLLLC